MLKAKNLNAVLSQNTSAQVTHIFLFAPPCALISYSSPSSPMAIRMQATLAAHVWSSYSSLASSGSIAAALPLLDNASAANPSAVDVQDTAHEERDDVKNITLEFTEIIFSIHRLKSGLLLCLAGPSTAPSEPILEPSSSSLASQSRNLPNGVGSFSRSDTAPSTSQKSSNKPAEHGDDEQGTSMRTAEILQIRAEVLATWFDEELAMFNMPMPTST
ncbi:MAG: hypothetical protein M1816_004528 [Peltula sp. TS41687]|nr:MAG: hypothetical protein M1816_004528 [Peltula sp. TS41687]